MAARLFVFIKFIKENILNGEVPWLRKNLCYIPGYAVKLIRCCPVTKRKWYCERVWLQFKPPRLIFFVWSYPTCCVVSLRAGLVSCVSYLYNTYTVKILYSIFVISWISCGYLRITDNFFLMSWLEYMHKIKRLADALRARIVFIFASLLVYEVSHGRCRAWLVLYFVCIYSPCTYFLYLVLTCKLLTDWLIAVMLANPKVTKHIRTTTIVHGVMSSNLFSHKPDMT